MANSNCNTVFVPLPSNKQFVDLTGKTFGRWTVLGYAGKKGQYRCWVCKCSCGVEKAVYGTNLASGKTISCGCHRNEVRTIHGHKRDPIYKIWLGIRSRCENADHRMYSSYGGRGIKCLVTLNEFMEFERNNKRPSSDHSIDRVDVNGHYATGNLRWATAKEQANNRRDNICVELDGITKTLGEWLVARSKEYNWARHQMHLGASPPEVVREALLRKERRLAGEKFRNCKTIYVTIDGVTKSLSGWLTGTSREYRWAQKRIARGKDREETVRAALVRIPTP